MNLALQWRMPEPALAVRWRGPEGALLAQIAANPAASVPTIIGPPGSIGPPGPQGPQGPQADLTAAIIDGGTFN
jgi:hypothetical protein